MNAKDLYDNIKLALIHFKIDSSQMHLMEMKFRTKYVIFAFENESLIVRILQ